MLNCDAVVLAQSRLLRVIGNMVEIDNVEVVLLGAQLGRWREESWGE
jgi:hypothetical protein